MIRLFCDKCKRRFEDDNTYTSHMSSMSSLLATPQDEWVRINACPFCSRRWLRTKVSGIRWKTYPRYKKVILKYSKIK